jgi:hypothetical protein
LINPFANLKEPPGAFIDDEDEDVELGTADDKWF